MDCGLVNNGPDVEFQMFYYLASKGLNSNNNTELLQKNVRGVTAFGGKRGFQLILI